ncbi:hypothetical protein [Robinsoniella peoriensis]|uniref:hypothetical protein n=1 Tax=Robinsoniella peoriensis TaxID=180332 RepID=UPI0005C7AE11|nr:hypothetical protein [Robinsoniella peoriensis]
MKKINSFAISLMLCIAITGCGKRADFDISVVVPAGNSEFVYSDEEISPLNNQITISSGEGLVDTEIVLKTIEGKDKNAYGPIYLSPGKPIDIHVKKGSWFKVGVSVQNTTDEDITVHVKFKDIEVRIE